MRSKIISYIVPYSKYNILSYCPASFRFFVSFSPPPRWRKFEVTSSSPGCEEHRGGGIRPRIRDIQGCPARCSEKVTAIPYAAAGDILGCQACGAQNVAGTGTVGRTHARLRKLLGLRKNGMILWFVMIWDSFFVVFESDVVWLHGHEGRTWYFNQLKLNESKLVYLNESKWIWQINNYIQLNSYAS